MTAAQEANKVTLTLQDKPQFSVTLKLQAERNSNNDSDDRNIHRHENIASTAINQKLQRTSQKGMVNKT